MAMHKLKDFTLRISLLFFCLFIGLSNLHADTEKKVFMTIEIVVFDGDLPKEGASGSFGNLSCKTATNGRCKLTVFESDLAHLSSEISSNNENDENEDTDSKHLKDLTVGQNRENERKVSSNGAATQENTNAENLANEFILKVGLGVREKSKKIQFLPGSSVLAVAVNQPEGLYLEVDAPERATALNEGSTSVEMEGPEIAFHGKVVSSSDEKPVAGAQIFVIGMDSDAVSSEDGVFKIRLKKNAKISIVHPSYSSLTSSPLTPTKEGGLSSDFPQIFKVSPSAIKLKEFVVTAPHIKGSVSSLLDERKQTKEVADVLGSEQMSKSGDSDAASALGRVTGLTLVDGKYIFIRGLDERYTAILLNGAKLPSPDPSKRVIPLDLFPTGIIESIKIQKSMTPSKTGEFGGGIISLRTKSYPDTFKAGVSMSLGLQSANVTGLPAIPMIRRDEVYTYEGGATDYLGLDDGTRELNGDVNRASTYKGRITSASYSDEEIKYYTKQFSGSWGVTSSEKSAPFSLKLELGDRFEWGGGEFGYNTALLYGDKYDRTDRELYRYIATDGRLDTIDKDLDYDISKRSVKFGVLGAVGAKFGKNHEVESTSILTRKTSDKVQLKSGSSGSGDDRFSAIKLEWNERKLEFSQLKGEHVLFNRLTIGWQYSRSLAQRYLPDTREYTYDIAEDTGRRRLSTRSSGATRTYSLLKDNVDDYSLDTDYKILDQDRFKVSVSVGANKFTKERNSKTKRYFYLFNDPQNNELSEEIDVILSNEKINSDLISIEEGTLNTDDYIAQQYLDSHYVSLNLDLFGWLQVNLGQRVEWTNQQVISYDKDAADKVPVKAELDDADNLPAFNTTFRFGRRFQLRFGYSQTLARPEFRELSTATFFDDTIDASVRGYPSLKRSLIDNRDVRFEFYPTANESLSIGYFVKDVDSPIEKYYITEGADSQVVTFRNSEKASNIGMELDWLIKPHLFSTAYGITLGGNFSVVNSETTIDPSKIEGASSVTSLDRPMQGVSPYSFNSYISFELYRHAAVFTMLVNVIGERITEIGTNKVPDIWEDPIETWDFVASKKVGRSRKVKLSFKAKDFKPSERITRQDGKVISLEKSQTELSFGIGYNF